MTMEQKKAIRILILEDSATDAELMELELRKVGLVFKTERVQSRETFIKALNEFKPDLILSDFKLPDFDGLATLKIVQQSHPEIPVIMVTGILSDIKAADLLDIGAKDYVLKDRMSRLGSAVMQALSSEQDILRRKEAEKAVQAGEMHYQAIMDGANDAISALKESEERFSYLAHHDSLTDLPNRLRFIANLEQAIEGAKRHKHKIALLYLDLDRFKQINDTLGHNIGDELLKKIAERLKICVRAEDTVARLGGDEFTVVLTEVVHAEDAGLIADKILKAVRKPITVSTGTIDPSISIGICIYPDDALDIEAMVKAADAALYHAKSMGRNCFHFFTPKLSSRAVEYTLIEPDLRSALENEEFELHYQPQVSLVDGKITGIEALIRWNHPEQGQLLPKKFIRIADDLNLIDSISEWVLRTAISDYEQWFKNGSSAPRIAINITEHQISNKQSIKQLLNVLDELAPAEHIIQFNLEITENALELIEDRVDVINTLRDRGVMFAIDNFGSGHSSLIRLMQFPIDSLKIDQSFVSDITDEGDDKAIAAAIIAMAHSLNLRVIGEGVETRSQLDVLRALGCDAIQGFYFSKPVPASEIARLLEKTYQ